MGPIPQFPDPRLAPPDGLIALGGDLAPQSLLAAYRMGIFPWPTYLPGRKEAVLAWFCPDPRAILEFSDVHVPRSLRKQGRSLGLRFTLDQAFDRVILACASSRRPKQEGTWITPEMINAYREFHRFGNAHSVEAWLDDELVGGIYGVEVQGVFSGESMFYRVDSASKLALLHLIGILTENGVDWIDIQQLTPHLKAMGARELSRDEFLQKLSRTHVLGLRPFGAGT